MLPEGFHHAQHLAQANARRQRAIPRFLDHWSVGRRVGERNAEFNHVCAGLHHAVHEGWGDVGIGETGGDEGNQGLAVLGFERGQRGVDAAHE